MVGAMEIDLTGFKINGFSVVVQRLAGFVFLVPGMRVPAVEGDGARGSEIPLYWHDKAVGTEADWDAMTPEAQGEQAIKMALKLLDHELRETLILNGERVLYPHPGPVPPVEVQFKPTRKEFRPWLGGLRCASPRF